MLFMLLLLLRVVVVAIPGLAKALKDFFQSRIGSLLLVQRHFHDLQWQRWERGISWMPWLNDPSMDGMAMTSIMGWWDMVMLLLLLSIITMLRIER